jgi:propanol-preferring alcohol dehydrogenase
VSLSLWSVSAALVIWVCNMPGTWGSRSPRFPVAPTRWNWQRSSAAHHYIDNAATDPAEALQALGGAKVVLITASGGKTVAETFKGLRPGGVSIVLGVGPEPIEVSAMDLIFGGRKLEGALTGNPATGDETLRFSALRGVSAMIETVPLEQAADAYAKMMAGKARFRMVLTMG